MNQRGFTLIEVMIVVVIVGILAAIAYPSYQGSVQKSRRSDAQAALTQAAALQEKWYFQNRQYSNNAADVGGATSPQGFYNISVQRPCGNGSCFRMEATAVGAQAADSDCAVLWLEHTGRRGASKADSSNSDICWND